MCSETSLTHALWTQGSFSVSWRRYSTALWGQLAVQAVQQHKLPAPIYVCRSPVTWHHQGRALTNAKNNIAGRMIPFLVPRCWDKNTVICAGTMPYRRYFLATTRTWGFQTKKGRILPAIILLAWIPFLVQQCERVPNAPSCKITCECLT